MNKKIILFLTIIFFTSGLFAQSDYKWFSSDSSGGPIYSWEDITSIGTQISMSGDDNNTGPHPIGFSFPFYGADYTTFRISTNGWISFTSTSSDYNNQELPGTNSPETMLAPFWDDLNFQSDKAYYYSDGSQLVITFNDVPRLGQEASSSYTFQIILNSNGQILYQYNTMTGALNGATIGWQDHTRTQGVSIVYNYANYELIHNGWAVRIEDINAGLAPPSGFTATASYQNVDLSWTASSSDSVTNYVIYRGTQSTSLPPLDSVASSVTSYSNTGLTNGTTYYYGLKSKSAGGSYSVMRTASATPNVAAPTSLSATASTSQVTLSWTAAIGSGVAHTLIYQGTSSSSLSLVDSTSDAATATKTITGLTNNTTYYFNLRSRASDGSLSSVTSYVEATPVYSGPVWWVSASVSTNGDGTSTTPFHYITSAIAAAAENDTIKLLAGTYTGANNRGLDTDKNLVFISASGADSTALDAGTYDRHFNINDEQDSTFQVIGLTLKNGKKSNDNGGSVYIFESSPIFKNCIFEENESGYNGGAVYIYEGSPEFRNCIFRNNLCSNNGGAIDIEGNYNSEVAFRPVFNNCSFTSNSITITGEYGSGNGAAVHFNGYGSAEFNDCQFRYNSITSTGGGYGGAININGNNNNDDQAENPVLLNRCSFIGNSISAQTNTYGAALKISSSTNIINCLIADNTMQGNQAESSNYWCPGAGIFIQLNSYWDSDEQTQEYGTVKIINSTIVYNDNNSSNQTGGGIYLNSMDNLTMFNTIIWGNTDDYSSGEQNINNQGTLLTDYNNIENGDSWTNLGSNSTYIDPQFSDATNGDYSLGLASSLVGTGTATFEGLSAPAVDIRNNITSYPRPNPAQTNHDMGAYESTYSSSPYPDAPTGLATTAGDGSIVLSWTANSESDIAKYGVYYGTESGPTVKQTEVSGGSTVTTTISGLSNNVTYYFRITAIDDDSYESDFSSEVSAAPAFSGSTIYVDNSGTEPANPDGSESNAYYSIQDAIDSESAENGKRILVKAGTYTGSGSSSNPVIDLKGKNIIIESDAGPATTIIDAGGSRTALSLDYQNGGYSGYSANATKFIGLTFTNGDDDKDMIDINGPNPNGSNNSWDVTFENCRFTNTDNDYGSSSAVVYVKRSSSVFDGCQFRDLNIIGNFNNNSQVYAPIKIQGGETNYFWNPITNQSELDTTVYRPQFKNCVIADNSVVNTASSGRSSMDNFYGGGITILKGAIPYFENTRIDSNTADVGGNYNYDNGYVYGGGIYIEGKFENDPPIKFVNCSISNNVAKGTAVYGGGIHSGSSQIQFINTVITNNLAYAAYSTDYDNVTVMGGGIYCYTNTGSNENTNYDSNDPLALLVNCTVANNKLRYIPASSIQWGGAGFTRNSSTDPVQIMNSIIYYNTVVGEESSSSAYFKMNLSQFYGPWGSDESIIGYSFIEHYDDSGVEGDEIYEYPPAFSDTANGDFSLSIASLAIGAGASEYEDVDAPDYDYNNSARPGSGGGNPDLGAYENSLAATPYPGKPQSLTVSSVDDSTVTLSWTAGTEDDLVRYRVYYGTSSPAATLIDSASATATSISIDGLTNGTTYYFRITVLDGDDYESVYSEEVSGVPEYKGPVWYVDVNDGSISAEGSTGDPFRDIQDAIDVSSAGDTVLVLPGTYAGNRSDNRELEFINDSDGSAKNIVLKSRDGAATTFIDSRNSRSFDFDDGTDTSLQIIGFTITSTTGGEYDGGGAFVRIQGNYYWDQSTEQSYLVPTSATFRNCIFTIFDSGSLQGEDLQDVAVSINAGAAIFDNCEFTNITVDYDDYSYGDPAGGAVRLNCGVLYINRSKLTNITVSRSTSGGVYGAAIQLNSCSVTDVTIINTIIADNLVSYTGGSGEYVDIRGGAINSFASGGSVQLINSTVVNNKLSTTSFLNPDQSSAIFFGDWNSDGYSPYLTIFNSIIHGNTKVTNAGSGSEATTNYGQIYLNEDNNDGVEGYASYSIIGGENNIEGDEILNLEPEFLDSTYALHPRSPAIGAGAVQGEDAEGNTIYAPTEDIAGNMRPNPADDDEYEDREAVPDLGAWENELAITPYPDAPTDLFVIEDHRSVQLFWNASDAEDVVEYKVYFSADSITFSLADSISGRYNTEGSVGGLTNEENYWFYVTSVDSNNYESSPSMQEKAKPHFQGPKWYVDTDNGSVNGEGSHEEPMRDIQDGIDAADEGDTVLVLPGTYNRSDDQNLTFNYDGNNNQPKHIVLISRGGPDSTIIDCEGSESAFVIMSGTDTTLQIIGFKIINGWSQSPSQGSAISIIAGGFVGGNGESQAAFKNCIIENGDGYGPAVFIIGGTGIFRDCVIRNNRHEANGDDLGNGGDINAGGIFVTSANYCCPEERFHGKLVLDRSKVVSNYIDYTGGVSPYNCHPRGAGIYTTDADISIRNSLIADNYFTGSNTCGSGVVGLDGVNSEITLINSTITGNQGYSGDDTGPSGFRANNYYYENYDYDTKTIIFNTIIAGNTPNSYQTDFDNSATDYFAVENSIFENSTDHDWFDPDDGHFDFNPQFADTTYVLSEYSRAIGRGGSSIEDADENDLLAPGVDLLGNPRPNPAESSPDLGAYEHVLSDYRRSVYYVDDANGDDEAPGLTIVTAVKSIANALIISSNRDTIELAAGTYSGADNRDLNMGGLTRIIRTSSGPASTIIDCENQGPAFVFDTDEPDSVHISGLTIVNGSSENGGAISISGADPVFENMIFRDNNSDGNGGAVYASDSYSSFTNCVFADNHAAQGGAFYLSDGAVSLKHCTLLDNTADDDSGIKNASGDLAVMNSIYWGNDEISGDVDVSYSNVMGGYDGTMNFNGRPGFTDAENSDLTLLDWSPMIGRGSTVNIVSADIAGTARADSVAPDLGAYENSLDSPATYSPVTWHVATTGIDTVVYSNIASITAPFSTLQWTMDHMLEGDSIIVHPGDHAGSADNGGKSVHIRGNAFAADEVSVLGELEFTGGSNSVNMLRVSNTSGDGFTISAGSINIADVLLDNFSGKAISVSDTADAAIANVTLYGNSYGIYDNSSGTITMVNSIIWSNTPGDTSINYGGDPVVTYSDIYTDIYNWGNTGTGNIELDPLFVDAANGDFNLDLLSPCIDFGDPSAVYDTDSTVADMGAFPRLRQFLTGTSDGDINVSADTTVIITEDFTVTADDSIELEPGAELYFGPGVTLTVEGSLTADGNSEGVISFLPLNPDSTFGGVVIGTDDGHRDGDSYSYIQISGVEAASIPLTVHGSATLNHVTIAGNGNPVSLSSSDVVDLNYSILEGTVDGTVNNTGSFTSDTIQFTDYANDDFTLLAAAAGIDTDTSSTDTDYSYADAGAYYHDQTDYPVTSITIHRPAYGDTILVSPDTSSVTGSISIIQLFNAYDRYKTNGVVSWNNGNAYGSFVTDSTNTTDLDGMISNIYVTNTVSSTHNSFSVRVGDVVSTSGQFLVEPGIPDSVWVTEQTAFNMTQLDSLTFTANVYDQFANPVRLGESATWSVNTVSGSGEGYTLSTDLVSTDTSGAVAVTLYTDPTDNSLSVGDQVTVEATSGPGSNASGVVTIIPSDIYNLVLDEEYTGEQLNVSADTAYMDFYTALIDTFDNSLENVEVFWEVVAGQGTGESLSASSSNTNTSGVATVRLNTNTVADSTYQVRCWVTEGSLLNAFGSFEGLANNVMNWNTTTTATNTTSDLGGIRGISGDRNRIIADETSRRRRGQFVPVQIGRPITVDRNINRDAVYDLDDTTAIVLVWPGATASVSVPQTATDLLLEDEFGFTLDAYDQFSNLVRDNTPVSWVITPSSENVSIVSSDDNTANGQASISLQVASNAAWDFSFTITATVEGISAETGTYRIDDVTAPAAVSGLSIDPIVWTSTNDFTLTWNNPSEHSGVAGAHYEITGESAVYVTGSGIQTLNFSLPANDERTVKLWLQDNAGNEDETNALTVTAKWDNTAPTSFDLTKPLAGWYKDANYRFEWEASSDATAGLDHYVWSLNDGGETATISPDSTGHTPSFGLAQGTHTWTVTAYDSSGNLTETSNPQSIQVDHTPPGITHNPVVEATENSAVVINAVFTEDGGGQSGIETAELYYRKGGEANWQPPVDMTTLNTYQIASSFSTSAGLEYYLHAVDVAGNVTDKPVEGFTSISVTITGGLASTDRWPTGIPNGTEVSSYQLWSFPGNPASSSPVDLLVDDLGDYDNTVWRLFAYGGGGAWTEFESLSKLNNGESYFIIVKDAGLSINTGQIYTIATNQPFEINLTSGDWTFVGNPFDFTIPLTSLGTTDSTSLSGDPNFYTYDGSWVNATSLEPWKGYIYKNPSASKLYINPGGDSGGMLGRQLADEIIIENDDNEWLVNISARNGLGRDNFNEVGLLVDAVDTYDNHDAFEPPLVPGGISVRIDNRNWPEYADTYTRDIRAPKEDGEYWDLEILAQDDEHNVYLTFEDLDMIPEELDVFAIDLTLGTAQDLRWRHVYRYAVPNPQEKHNVRFIAGTRDFLQKNNAGVELFPDRYALSQNYPNPFNPQTSIILTMQDGATVNLVVYNLLGEEIAVLADNEYRPAGYHNFIWKGLNNNGQRVASGVYFYMAQVVSPKGEVLISDTHKMVLVK